VFYQLARYIPETEKILALASEKDRLSFWQFPIDGQSEGKKVFTAKTSIFGQPSVSPNGKKFAWYDSNYLLWVTDIESGKAHRIFQSNPHFPENTVIWSPDSRWLAFTRRSDNQNIQIYLHNLETGSSTPVTSDRSESFSPVWSQDGQWLYFIAHRFYHSKVRAPSGHNQPEPFSEQNTGIFMVALNHEVQWPFSPDNELMAQSQEKEETRPEPDQEPAEFTVNIDLKGIEKQIYQAPIPPGQYTELTLSGDYMLWLEPDDKNTNTLRSMAISADSQPITLATNVLRYINSYDEEGVVYLTDQDFFYKPLGTDLSVTTEAIALDNWRIKITPQDEWTQILYDVWVMYRDYFTVPDMKANGWKAALEKQLPLLSRITDRQELDVLLGRMLSELGVLHTYTYPGDQRNNNSWAYEGALGATFEKEPSGFRIKHIHKADPEWPNHLSPLAKPGSRINEGDLITHINQQSIQPIQSPEELLTFQKDSQVLLTLKKSNTEQTYQEIVEPLSSRNASKLRYREWVEQRREKVEEQSEGTIGYVHLSSLISEDFSEWVRQYYPVHNRDGLILDIRNNTGGNISSWILNRLMRKAYTYISTRGHKDSWNMQYAFRGHIVLLVNEYTMSDAEELMDGFRQLKLGTIIGSRSWGGRIFIYIRPLLDNGAVSLPFHEHYFANQTWPSENWGVEPDIQVDNLPYETYNGEDAQLDRAIKHLKEQIRKAPVHPFPKPPE
jgi:tricorn protease